MVGLGPLEVLFVAALLLGLPSLLITLWGIIDAANRPDYAWAAAGQNKLLWILLQAGGLVITGIGGLIMAIVYLAAIRPKVRAGEAPGPSGRPIPG